jgi:hypothetical protein
LVAALYILVLNIVVDQREVVDQFQSRSRGQCLIGVFVKRLAGEQT